MPVVEIEADHLPELAENGGAYLLAEQIGLTEVELASASARRQALSQAPTDELVQSIIGLNAIMRGGRPEDGRIEDGILPMSDTPPFEDKGPLLHQTVEAVKYILSDHELDDATALRRAGLTLNGGLSYIHPFKNAIGRTGRLFQYFAEFGAERGKFLFEAETFSAIGKVAVLSGDMRTAVSTTPPVELEAALSIYCQTRFPEQWQAADGRQAAGMRVRAFLDAMTGRAQVLSVHDSYVTHTEPGTLAAPLHFVRRDGKKFMERGTFGAKAMPPGTDIRELYEAEYVGRSFAPHDDPSLVPEGAQRVPVQKLAAVTRMIEVASLDEID